MNSKWWIKQGSVKPTTTRTDEGAKNEREGCSPEGSVELGRVWSDHLDQVGDLAPGQLAAPEQGLEAPPAERLRDGGLLLGQELEDRHRDLHCHVVKHLRAVGWSKHKNTLYFSTRLFQPDRSVHSKPSALHQASEHDPDFYY